LPGYPEVGSPSDEHYAQARHHVTELACTAIHALLKETKLEQLSSLAKGMRLSWPIANFRVIDKKLMRTNELKIWSQCQKVGESHHSQMTEAEMRGYINPSYLKPVVS